MEEYVRDKDGFTTVTMTELLGLDDLVVLQGGQTPWIKSSMGEEWSDDRLDFYLDLSDPRDYRVLTVVCSDMIRTQLPDPMFSDKGHTYRRVKEILIRNIKRAQVRRALSMVEVSGISDGAEVYVPMDVKKPITFVPFYMYNEAHKDMMADGNFVESFNSTLYEVFRDASFIR